MTIHRTVRAVIVLAAIQSAAGCATMRPRGLPEPSAAEAWPSAIALAQSRGTDGKFDAADTVLAEFATRYPGTSEALETAYWRALYKLDPSNPRASFPAAMGLLDGYLADSRRRAHADEAAIIRRVAGQLEGLSKLAASAMSQAKDATSSAAAARSQMADGTIASKTDASTADAEIKRLKDELAKANTELERIRKRLSQPPPKP